MFLAANFPFIQPRRVTVLLTVKFMVASDDDQHAYVAR